MASLFGAIAEGDPDRVRALVAADAGAVARAHPSGLFPLVAAVMYGQHECLRALLGAGADVAQALPNGMTVLMAASTQGKLECVRALLEAGAAVAQATAHGVTALMHATMGGHVECVRALLEAGGAAVVLQLSDGGNCALKFAGESLEVLQLLCAYAPSRDAARAHLPHESFISPACADWLDATRRWSSRLHHYELLPLARVRALLAAGADVHAGDGQPHAPTPLSLATARLLRGDGAAADGRAAALIVAAAAPWSPATHALFPARDKARAAELLRIGWLLARRFQGLLADTAQMEVAFCDAWLGHVMPHAIERSSG
jgi:hypothetical protein